MIELIYQVRDGTLTDRPHATRRRNITQRRQRRDGKTDPNERFGPTKGGRSIGRATGGASRLVERLAALGGLGRQLAGEPGGELRAADRQVRAGVPAARARALSVRRDAAQAAGRSATRSRTISRAAYPSSRERKPSGAVSKTPNWKPEQASDETEATAGRHSTSQTISCASTSTVRRHPAARCGVLRGTGCGTREAQTVRRGRARDRAPDAGRYRERWGCQSRAGRRLAPPPSRRP